MHVMILNLEPTINIKHGQNLNSGAAQQHFQCRSDRGPLCSLYPPEDSRLGQISILTLCLFYLFSFLNDASQWLTRPHAVAVDLVIAVSVLWACICSEVAFSLYSTTFGVSRSGFWLRYKTNDRLDNQTQIPLNDLGLVGFFAQLNQTGLTECTSNPQVNTIILTACYFWCVASTLSVQGKEWHI